MKQKVGSFKSLTRSTNHYPTYTKQRKEKTQINKIKDEKGNITTNTSGIQKIIRVF
jgi:hypothetical protein